MNRIALLLFLSLSSTRPGAPAEPLADTVVQARDLFRREQYAEAGRRFHNIAEAAGTPRGVAAVALFYEAECLRLRQRYPQAATVYQQLLELPRVGPLREASFQSLRDQAFRHLYEIANYWLEDTRIQMRQAREWREWTPAFPELSFGGIDFSLSELVKQVVPPTLYRRNLFHWDRTKPFFNEEGKAVQSLLFLESAGAPGDLIHRALFLAGAVSFYRESYREAEGPLGRLVSKYPRSPLAPQALELALIAKTNLLGQGQEDERLVRESRELIRKAEVEYPELWARQNELLKSKGLSLDYFESERDLKKADAARCAGRTEQARKLYKALIRSFPHTESASTAQKLLKGRSEKAPPSDAVPQRPKG